MIDDEKRAVTGVSSRRAALLQDLRTRLGPVCQGWPDELFSSMIQQLADITLRYDGYASTSTYDTRTPDHLVANLKTVLGREEEKANPEDRNAK
jgi:hypothetical protein